MKPFLKWAGGKARLAPRIREALGGPCQGTYFEPFAGSLAVYFARAAAGEVGAASLSDANAKLIATMQAVQLDVEAVLGALAQLPQDESWRDSYYAIRDHYNRGPHEGPAHAARFIWLNKAGFNGLYRENSKGQHNVPAGRYKRPHLPSGDGVRAAATLLGPADLAVQPFCVALEQAGPGDQVYCDPPYVPLTATAHFTRYSQDGFDADDQRDLADAAQAAVGRGARVVLSNHDTTFVHELYASRGFEIERFDVQRSISRKGSTRGPISEVLASAGS